MSLDLGDSFWYPGGEPGTREGFPGLCQLNFIYPTSFHANCVAPCNQTRNSEFFFIPVYFKIVATTLHFLLLQKQHHCLFLHPQTSAASHSCRAATTTQKPSDSLDHGEYGGCLLFLHPWAQPLSLPSTLRKMLKL